MAPTAWPVRGMAVLLAVSLVVGGAAGGVAGDEAVSTSSNGTLQVAEPTPTNETTRHEDPRAVDADGDLAAVRAWLAGRMAVRLETCAVDVGAGTTDVCELGDDYPAWLRKYVDVADDTREETDDRVGGTFEQAPESADEYASSVATFRETHRTYRDARAAGDEDRARTLARELQRRGAAVDTAGGDVVGTFRDLERGADVDLSDGRESVNDTRANVTAIVEEVEREQFVPTVLTVELEPRTISFLEPGTATGRLATENGTGVANRTVRFAIGDRLVETRTDAAGSFAFTYRPTTLPRSTESLPVSYRPRNASAYLASETTVPVTVSPVTPDVTVSVNPESARYGDALTVSGRVAADDVGAPGVPVVVALDGRRVGQVRTDRSGAFALTAPVGATDGPGAVAVTATMPLADRALATADGSASVTIDSTATALRLDATTDGQATVAVEGALRTTGGRNVPGQSVAVRVNGTSVESLQTNADGDFRGTATVPSALREQGAATVRVAVRYEGAGTNLGPSNASALVTLPVDGAGSSSGDAVDGVLARSVEALPGELSRWQLLGGVGLGVLLVLGVFLWRRGIRPGRFGSAERAARPDADDPSLALDPSSGGERPSPLDAARDRLAADPDGAVMLAYEAVREALATGDRPERRLADTHWEFLSACRQDGLGDAAVATLTDLTEAYELAAYAPSPVSPADAASALETAAEFV